MNTVNSVVSVTSAANSAKRHAAANLAPLTWAWLVLVVLTIASLGLGHWFHGAVWLPLLVAAIVWVKGRLVARQFIGAPEAHPYVAWVLRIFVAFAPIALVLLTFFGGQFARWATL